MAAQGSTTGLAAQPAQGNMVNMHMSPGIDILKTKQGKKETGLRGACAVSTHVHTYTYIHVIIVVVHHNQLSHTCSIMKQLCACMH